jgi:hypothetical protein
LRILLIQNHFNMTSRSSWIGCIAILSLCVFSTTIISAQETGMKLQVIPESLNLKVGESARLQVTAMDQDGNEMSTDGLRFFARRGRIASADSVGMVKAMAPGEATIIVLLSVDGKFLRTDVPVHVAFPPIAEVAFPEDLTSSYTHITTPIEVVVTDEMDFVRDDVEVSFSTSNPELASFDEFNNLTAHTPGGVTLIAVVEDVRAEKTIEILPNPVQSIQLTGNMTTARTGDVIQYTATAYDADGNEVTQVPITFAFTGKTTNSMEFASGLIMDDGRFVAYRPGMYRVKASAGLVVAQTTVKITSRAEIRREVELVGRGAVNNKHTSDLWVWEGVDGRDYAVTGTWGADGEAFFWDVTDPTNMQLVDTIQVDARTVNDVKVSEDGSVCVISREGASSRKNGIILIDVTNPREVRKIGEFTDGLTGGVHNLFIYQNHVYALSAGERYDVINIEDPTQPYKVGSFELEKPGHAIHDVWIHDGIAYSSNWQDGVQLVDVGNGIAGGSPSNPVKFASYAYPSGWNHAAFPYFDKTTGKFYVIAGDEAFPYGLNLETPTIAAGWLHFIDFTDPQNPKEVAKYEVPGAGSHNFWVEGDLLYVANYNAGLRIVDLAGDLIGDLREQGREIGWFLPHDPSGYVPNAAMTWGPQPHKGNIFFSDWNSGLWAVKMKEKQLVN